MRINAEKLDISLINHHSDRLYLLCAIQSTVDSAAHNFDDLDGAPSESTKLTADPKAGDGFSAL